MNNCNRAKKKVLYKVHISIKLNSDTGLIWIYRSEATSGI